ncbi:MAG TPA: helix-turn-helix domain-containing protein [Thermoanaerobaculia bacterium]|nr:helix-turn-helix domain-containing protein [Thermoanaerobaculia bacterium]
MRFDALLRNEFERRRRSNPRYSLRSFARTLGIDHSTLSQLLRGKRRVTPAVVRALGARLSLAPAHLDELCARETDALVLGALARGDFRPNARWLAIRLGISIDDINISLQRLLRTGAMVMTARESWEVARG